MGTAATHIRTQHEPQTHVCKCQRNTGSFGMATSNPSLGIGFMIKWIVRRKFRLQESRPNGNWGNSSRRQRELRSTHQAPCGRISVKKKKETGLQHYIHIIGVLSTNNLIYHYYIKKQPTGAI